MTITCLQFEDILYNVIQANCFLTEAAKDFVYRGCCNIFCHSKISFRKIVNCNYIIKINPVRVSTKVA